jgi:hypothetical protein
MNTGVLLTEFIKCMGIPVQMDGESDPFRGPGFDVVIPDVGTFPVLGSNALATVTIRSSTQGQDEFLTTFDEDDDTLIPEQRGIRPFTVTVRVETLPPNTTGAHEYLERLRSRIRRPGSQAQLNANGMAFLRSEDIVSVNWTVDGRQHDACVMDLYFHEFRKEVDTTDPGDYIETINAGANPPGDIPGDIDP